MSSSCHLLTSMKTKNVAVWIAFVFIVLGLGVSLYLTSHHFNLQYGLSDAKSFCSVSSVIDCDSVNASSYSEVFGIPVAIFAAFAFLVELLLLLGFKAFGVDERQKMSRYFFYLATCNMIATITMGVISSLILKTYCLMCMTIWLVSIVIFLCARALINERNYSRVGSDFKNLFRGGPEGSRGILFLFLLVPVGSILLNGMWKQNIMGDTDGVEKIVQNSLSDWHNNRKIDFFINHAPQTGNPNAIMQIVEFSDFQCPHCKRAAPSLHAFVNAHRDEVHFIFQNFPLDPTCNKDMKSEGHNQACRFAKASLCAERQGKFTQAHDWIFQHQDDLAESLIPKLISEENLDSQAFNSCMNDPEISGEITQSLERGRLAGLEGTPSIFVNGRLLPGGFLIPVLDAALKSLH
jgi:protein-disulfide isomerase/uncharacterized membrane protein